MNSSVPSATKRPTTSVEARRASTWIERFALPIAISAMEAQPIGLVLAFGAFLVSRSVESSPIGVGGIALIALGLLWWAMFVEHLMQHSTDKKRAETLSILGWLVALAVTVGPLLPALALGNDIPAALVNAALVTWLWRRGISRAQMGFEYVPLANSFKIGFGVLLGLLVLVIALPGLEALRDALASSLPVFFLSGLVGLSLARLGAIRNTRRVLDGSQADPTRTWLLALTLFGVALIILVIAIESIFSFTSFRLVLTALTPVWNALGTLVSWIIYGITIIVFTPIFNLISYLLGLLPHHTTSSQKPQNIGPRHQPFQQPWSPQTIPPELMTLGRWLFLALAVIVILMVVRASLRRWYGMSGGEGVEEVREGLDASSLLSQRWREWWNRRRRKKEASSALEPLDPGSARARYREMLSAIAATKEDLARTPAETPAEYEARLLGHLGKERLPAQDLIHNDEVPTDSTILNELTHAYARERYGGKQTDSSRRAYLQAWGPRLIERLIGRARM